MRLTAPKPDDDRRRLPWLFALSCSTVAVLLLALPWIVGAAVGILTLDSSTPIEWVPTSFAPRVAYDRFTREFESGDVVVASWPGCVLGEESIDRFVAAATGPDAPRDPSGAPWFERVVSGNQVLRRLVEPPLSLDREAAVERLVGVLVGPDRKQTCVVIGFTRAGLADRRRATGWIRDRLSADDDVAAGTLRLAGPVIDNVSVDDASTGSLRTYGGPAALLIFLLTWWSVGSVAHAALVFLLSAACVGLSFVSLAAWGDRMNPVLIVMPLLVLTLGVSGGIHLVNYLVESRKHHPADEAARRAIALGWLPCSLSAGTTALGLVSLVVSDLEPIRVFGFHAACGVLATLAVLFLVVPGFFSRWPITRRAGGHAHGRLGHRCADVTIGRAGTIVSVAAAAMAAAALGIPGIRASVAIDTLFTAESPVIRDYRWLEQAIGPLAPVEVVLRFRPDCPLRPAQRLDLVRAVGSTLGSLAGVTGVVSAATFLPGAESASGTRAIARRAVVARRLSATLSRLEDMRLVREIDGEQLWRVTARTSALAGIDYDDFLGRGRAHVEPLISPHDGVHVDWTGVMPLANAIQKTLLHDLFTSFISACVVITVVMMVMEGSPVAGAVAMIPNVFPMILLFGLLGWSGIALDIGSVMTASIALGMAVDGTFHFLTFFRRGLVGTGHGGRVTAVRDAYRHSAAALAESALVCGLGILAFAPSSFAPSRRFAWMLALMIAAALLGDLVLLPALLAGRAGTWFRPRARRFASLGADDRVS